MNQDVINHLLECTDTCKEVSHELYSLLSRGSIKDFNKVGSEFVIFLKKIQQTSDTYYDREGTVKLGNAVESVLYSLRNIIDYSKINIPLALNKIEFELIPFTKTMYAEFYFWSSVYPYREKWEDYYKNIMPDLYFNTYIEKSITTGEYKYDLSILIIGYNKLEYTQTCVRSVMMNLPEDVSCELILFNHGSNDGTKDFYESIRPTKQIDVKINGSLNYVYTRIIEGKYILFISNDTIITPYSIDNMLRILKENDDVGRVVPSTPNVSNLQTISSEFDDINQLMDWSKKNNAYDIYRHEVRTRLCDPISMMKSKDYLSKSGINMVGRYYTSLDFESFSFPDDEISMLFRRSSLKNILAKDAYCYHFGSVTINGISKEKKIDSDKMYLNGRKEFMRAFGIDPWGTGFCYDYNLFNSFDCKFDNHIEILGINCGMGSNSLKIKELYKENNHNLDVYLNNCVSEEVLIGELKAYSDEVHLISTIEEISVRQNKQYNYIVFEDPFANFEHKISDIEYLHDFLVNGGELYLKSNIEIVSEKYTKVERISEWLKFTK